jgi:hypothetical protein
MVGEDEKTQLVIVTRSILEGEGNLYDRNLLAAKTPSTTKVMQIAKKIKKSTFAISAAPSAIPPKPNSAATIEITKKIAAQRSIISLYPFAAPMDISLLDGTTSFPQPLIRQQRAVSV